jgi:capsular exopolysaccharide synthesis family protein
MIDRPQWSMFRQGDALGPLVKTVSEFFRAPERPTRDRQRLEATREAPADLDRRRQQAGGRNASKPRSLLSRWFRSRVPVLITRLHPASMAADAYHTVRTNLEFLRTDRPFRSVVVTSPTSGSGKSTTAANLAAATAQSGLRVCLVDADLRRPVLHEVFGLPDTGGLTTTLRDGVSLQSVARATVVRNLFLVVSGRHGAGLGQHHLASHRLQKVITEASGDFDLVIYDTPPILSVAETVSFAALCDGVVLVVRAGSIPFSVLLRSVQQIEQVNGRLLGVLLNEVNLRSGDYDAYRYYRAYYGEKSRE